MRQFKQRGIATPVILFLVFTIIGIAAVTFEKKDDGPVEEYAESEIKELTGIDIDFTPASEE